MSHAHIRGLFLTLLILIRTLGANKTPLKLFKAMRS